MSLTLSRSTMRASYETPSLFVAHEAASSSAGSAARSIVLVDGVQRPEFARWRPAAALFLISCHPRLSQVLRERSARLPFARRLWIYTDVAFQHPYQAVRL